MADTIEVTIPALAGDCELMRGSVAGAQRSCDALRESSSVLCQSWEGTAAQTFMESLQADLSELGENLETLERFREAAEQAQEEYRRCEADIRRVIAALTS